MNMLIIGNGFDLAHGRPTTYSDFLQFLNYILWARDYRADRAEFESYLNIDCPSVKEYILSSFDTRKNPGSDSVGNTNGAVQELYNCLDKNVWYEYFHQIYTRNKIHGQNWIDFEGEIREIIEPFDRHIYNIYDGLPHSQNLFSAGTDNVKLFREKLDFNGYNFQNQKDELIIITYSDFIKKSYQDLEKLIRCLEIYLDDCVRKMPIPCYSPDIKELKIDSVLSFNYTIIPTDIYPSLINTHHIHGHAKADRPATENDMVLGVNEYWEGNDKNTHTNFNLYKKFVQRIIKGTGINYKKTLEHICSGYDKFQKVCESGNFAQPENHVYIFGHSLDATDGDILREVIRTPSVVTTIFYRNKQQQADQIANLSKVLSQDELLERTFSTSPTIIFKQQAEMVAR